MSAIDVSPGSRVVENRPAEAYAVGLDSEKGAIFGNGTAGADTPGFSALCHVIVQYGPHSVP